MPGLRNKKKQAVRERILDAAQTLILENGYEGATTDDIAIHAEIAAGTLYNYFGSKAELYTEVFTRMYGDAEGWLAGNFDPDSDQNPADLLMAFLEKTLSPFRGLPVALLRDMMHAGLMFFKKKPTLFTKLVDMDLKLLSSLSAALEQLQGAGRLSLRQSARDTAELFYGAICYEGILWLYAEDHAYDEMMRRIRHKLECLL